MSLNHITTQTKPKSKSFSQGKMQGSTGSSKKVSGKSKYGKKQSQRKAQPPVAPKAPTKEYVSVCCTVLATKPRAGRKETAQSPESKKMQEVVKGLGHWRCGACNKPCKVTPRAPQPKMDAVVTVHTPLDIKVPITVDAAKFEGVPFYDIVATLPS